MKDNHFKANVDRELYRLVERYNNAGGLVIELLNALGQQADGLLGQLPLKARDGLEAATEKALVQAMKAADRSRSIRGSETGWLQTTFATALGAAGGAGGVGTALAELPVTTTVFLRAIQDVAEQYEFDATSENVKFDCVQVFAAGGPLSEDDAADLAFLSSRMALSSGGTQKLIAWVTPRLAVVLGQKLAAQMVPVIGATTGGSDELCLHELLPRNGACAFRVAAFVDRRRCAASRAGHDVSRRGIASGARPAQRVTLAQ